MNRRQMLKLLKQGADPLDLSIQKWQDIVDGKGKDNGVNNCALCEHYQDNDGCGDCPVYDETGLMYCGGTPYVAIEDLQVGKKIPKELAQRELDFLKSLKKEAPKNE